MLKFLTAKLGLTQYCIVHRFYWIGVGIFSTHSFSLTAHQAGHQPQIRLRKVTREKICNSQRSSRFVCSWLVSSTVDEDFQCQIAQKSSNQSKLALSMKVYTWISDISFHLRQFWLQTLITIN